MLRSLHSSNRMCLHFRFLSTPRTTKTFCWDWDLLQGIENLVCHFVDSGCCMTEMTEYAHALLAYCCRLLRFRDDAFLSYPIWSLRSFYAEPCFFFFTCFCRNNTAQRIHILLAGIPLPLSQVFFSTSLARHICAFWDARKDRILWRPNHPPIL